VTRARPVTALPDHVRRNRDAWDEWSQAYAGPGRHDWASTEPVYGLWRVPETELHVLPDDLAGQDTIELGCGTAYVSAWLARLGARPVGIDNSEKQLATARSLQREFGLEFPLIHGNAEDVPLPDASFDLAISEYGASIWADPYRWVPEAARLLRPGGRLIFLVNGAILMLCVPETEADGPAGDRLLRDYFRSPRVEWPDSTAVEFHLAHGDWIRLLRANSFEIEDLLEIQGPEGATSDPRWTYVTPDWARRWPAEEIWKARKAD
jgi:SAM-dependent methyltransferase